MNFCIKLFSTFFFVGKFPIAPGTMATAAGMFLVYYLSPMPAVYAITTIGLLFAGIWSSNQMEKILKQKDPGCVVIDEVVGIMVACIALPLTWPVMLSAFFLFRAFDMFKIYPINRIEKLGGGIGIMLDDVMAGVYTNIILRIALLVVGGN